MIENLPKRLFYKQYVINLNMKNSNQYQWDEHYTVIAKRCKHCNKFVDVGLFHVCHGLIQSTCKPCISHIYKQKYDNRKKNTVEYRKYLSEQLAKYHKIRNDNPQKYQKLLKHRKEYSHLRYNEIKNFQPDKYQKLLKIQRELSNQRYANLKS